MKVGGWSGGYMGEGMGVEGTWGEGGGYVGEGRGWGGVHLQHVQHTNAEAQKKFFTVFLSLVANLDGFHFIERF